MVEVAVFKLPCSVLCSRSLTMKSRNIILFLLVLHIASQLQKGSNLSSSQRNFSLLEAHSHQLSLLHSTTKKALWISSSTTLIVFNWFKASLKKSQSTESKKVKPNTMRKLPSFWESATTFIKYLALSLPTSKRNGLKKKRFLLKKMSLHHQSQLRPLNKRVLLRQLNRNLPMLRWNRKSRSSLKLPSKSMRSVKRTRRQQALSESILNHMPCLKM